MIQNTKNMATLRRQEAVDAYFKNKDAKAKEADDKKTAQLYEDARVASGNYLNKKYTARINEDKRMKLNGYKQKAFNVIMTEYLSQVVEKSLLLDTTIYEGLFPEYKLDIRTKVRAILENADINTDDLNESTIKLMENIEKNIPEDATGIYLSEDEIQAYFSNNKIDADEELNKLSTNVKYKIGEIVRKDMEISDEIQDACISISSEKSFISSANAGVEEITDSFPMDEAIVNNRKDKTLLEVLSLNNVSDMLEEGKEIDIDLALANSIQYITVMETLSVSGLVTIDEGTYNDIVKRFNPMSQKSYKKEYEIKKARSLKESQNTPKTEPKKSMVPLYLAEFYHGGNINEVLASDPNKYGVEIPVSTPVISDNPINATIQSYRIGDYVNDKTGEVFNEQKMHNYCDQKGYDELFDDFEESYKKLGFRKIKK